MTRSLRNLTVAACGLSVLLMDGGAAARGDEITLKDGTTVSATIVQKDAESVFLELPRASIVSVNGRPMSPPVAAGVAAPEFTATDLSGATHSLASYRGQVVLLQFWASWCPHCRSDTAYLKALSTRYGSRGLRVVTVSVDQDLAKLKAFLQKEQIAYPVIAALDAPALPELYEAQGVPGYYLIDAKGVIAKVWSGSLSEGGAHGQAEFDALLATLLPSG